MTEAIKLAMDNGYSIPLHTKPSDYEVILLSPLFWQALGRAKGWDKKAWHDEFGGEPWLDKALIYLEITLRGGDQDKFWRDIINENGERGKE